MAAIEGEGSRPACESAHDSTMRAVLDEIDRFKQGMPGLLLALGRDEAPKLRVMGLEPFYQSCRETSKTNRSST